MNMLKRQINVEETLMNRNIHAIVMNHDVPGLEFIGNINYDGSYIYIFRVYNKRRTEFFNVFAYSREECTPCYSVRFSRIFKSFKAA